MRFVWLLLPLLAGCAVLPPSPSDWRRCRFEVASLGFKGFRENHTEWQIVLAAHNPNSRRLKLQGLMLYALREGDTLARVENEKPLDLAARDSTPVALSVRLPHSVWTSALAASGSDKPVSITVAGDASYKTWFGTKRFRNVVRKTYEIDPRAAMETMGGGFLRGLFR